MALSLSECTAQCKKFRCDRKPSELKISGKGESKTVWCTWVNDECDGPWCMYGICMDRRMTSDGRCKGFKKASAPIRSPDIEDFSSEEDEQIPDRFQKEISGRRMS
ncbi:MAG: hypothetical protein ACXADC_00365 [Candidatus Thorarchaeota archaeon]